jgi:hypothetical protein
MKSRGLIYTLLAIAIFAFLFLFLVFGVSPPRAPNENILRFGNTDWSLDNNPRVYGVTTWSRFADYPANATIEHSNTIKVEHTIYWGFIPYDSEAMSWEVENGNYSSRSLTFNDLMGRWQGSESVFTFKQGDDFFQVTFSIPKLENGTSKYATLLEAWDEGELYQIIERL